MLQKPGRTLTSGSGCWSYSRASSFSPEDFFSEIPAWCRLPLWRKRKVTAVPLARFRAFCIGIQINRFSGECPLLLILFFYVNCRRWNRLRILRIYYQKITSPTSPRFQRLPNEYSRKDLCTKLMHSTLVFWRSWIFFYVYSKWNNPHKKMVNWIVVHEASGHLLEGLAHFGDSSTTPWLLPTSFLAVQTEPVLPKFLLSLVVQLVLQFHVFRICAA